MSNYIKLSQLNQKFIQNKQAKQNNASASLKVQDDGLKQDTFVNRHKKAIIFGSILGGIGIAVGVAFQAYKGKLGSKAQSFVEGFINKSNKVSDNATNATSKSVASATGEKTPIPTAPVKIDVQDKVEIPQKPVHEVVAPNKITAEPQVNPKTEPTPQAEIIKRADETGTVQKDQQLPETTPIVAFKPQAKSDDEILDICLKGRDGDIRISKDEHEKIEILNLGEELSKTLCTDDKKKIFNLIKTEKMLQEETEIDKFPVILGEEENKLLRLYLEKNGDLSAAQQELLDKLIARNLELTQLSEKYQQLIYGTPFNPELALKNANSSIRTDLRGYSFDEGGFMEYEKKHQPAGKNDFEWFIRWQKGRRYPVIDLTKIPDTEDLSKFGFPEGTTKKDLRFYVHMIEDRGILKSNILEYNLNRILDAMDGYDTLWSKSLISCDKQNTFFNRHYGFITDSKIGQMHITYTDGRLSGYSKNMHECLRQILENDKEIDRLTSLPNFIKEKLNLSDDEYIELAKILKTKGNIFSDDLASEVLDIGGRKISVKEIREAVSLSQDKLFETIKTWNNSENNEVIDETCDILAFIIKSTKDYQPSYECFVDNSYYIANFLDDFETKTGRKLPIIII